MRRLLVAIALFCGPVLACIAALSAPIRPIMMSTSVKAGVTLSPNPATITAGSLSTLTWSSSQPSCTSPDIPAFPGTGSGSTSVSPSSTTTYHVTCGVATASATVTVNPGSGTQPDLGVVYNGAVAAAATQAGYTHLAANYDFSYTGSFTDEAGSHNGWSDIWAGGGSTWFLCSINTSSPYLFGRGFDFGSGAPCDSNHWNVTTDSSVGRQVLTSSYYQTDANNGQPGNNIVTVDSGATSGGRDPRDPFRAGMYMELVYKFSLTDACGGNNCALSAFSTFAAQVSGGNPCFLASDNESPSGTATQMGWPLWNNAPCGVNNGCSGANCALPNGPNANNSLNTNYNTYGQLRTIDTVNNCAAGNIFFSPGIINGLTRTAFIGSSGACNAYGLISGDGTNTTGVITIPANASIASTPEFMYLGAGPLQNPPPSACGQPKCYGSAYWQVPQLTVSIASIRIWTCPNYKTAACTYTPAITSQPP